MKQLALDNSLYLDLQSKHILERIELFGNKLYLEFGGKLFDDHHAARVLPGFLPNSKLKMLMTLKEKVEIIIVVNANDIVNNKVRGDLGITYEDDTLRLIDAFRDNELFVGSVVISRYEHQQATKKFADYLQSLGIKVYFHYHIDGYPNNIEHIVSDEGFGKNDYIKTSKPLVVVTAPGPGSGKMSTCLSQLYHEHKNNVRAGYAKYETFPVWNLPLKHPVNLAYEAATADLNDVNMIDPFHLDAYGEKAVNYNRDVEIFPVLQAMFKKILGTSPYQSPTDMGVNMVGLSIINDEAAINAAEQEITRRFYLTSEEVKKGHATQTQVDKIALIMSQANIKKTDRKSVAAALAKFEETNEPAVAIELNDGTIITGKTTPLLGSASAALMNALKTLGNLNDEYLLISPAIIETIQSLKTNHLHNINPRLHTDEVLIALAMSATTNPLSHLAMEQLPKLEGCEAHSTVILSEIDKKIFRKLKVKLTSEPQYQDDKLYHN